MEEYITREMPLAVFLTANGHTHQRMERKGRACHWVFHKLGNLEELVVSYFNGSADVDVQDALDIGRAIREEMSSFMRGTRV